MKTQLGMVAMSVFVLFLNTPSGAQDDACVDRAQTQKELDQCGRDVTIPLEEQAYEEFKRLAKKFKGNGEMEELLRQAEHYWKGVHNYQCMLEGTAAEGGSTKKPLPLESAKAFERCVIRIAREIHAALVKL